MTKRGQLSERHLRSHIRRWTDTWAKYNGSYGFTVNTLCALTRQPPARIVDALRDMPDMFASWCSVTGGYVWGRAGNSKTGARYTAQRWALQHYYAPFRDMRHTSHDEAYDYALKVAEDLGPCALNGGRRDDNELVRVLRSMCLPVPIPAADKITDSNCVYCDIKDGGLAAKFKRRAKLEKTYWAHYDKGENAFYRLATDNAWAGVYYHPADHCKICKEYTEFEEWLENRAQDGFDDRENE